ARQGELRGFDERFVSAGALGEVSRSGYLDIVPGASPAEGRFFYPSPAVTRLWRNKGGGKFEPETLAGPPGETLTLLFTDLNGDDWPDLFVGNDFDERERVYLNYLGKLRSDKAAASPNPHSTAANTA